MKKMIQEWIFQLGNIFVRTHKSKMGEDIIKIYIVGWIMNINACRIVSDELSSKSYQMLMIKTISREHISIIYGRWNTRDTFKILQKK